MWSQTIYLRVNYRPQTQQNYLLKIRWREILSNVLISELEHAAQALSAVKQIERRVDVSQLHVVGDVLVHLDLLLTRYRERFIKLY